MDASNEFLMLCSRLPRLVHCNYHMFLVQCCGYRTWPRHGPCTVAKFVRGEGMTGKLPIVLRCGTSVSEALYPRETSCKYTNVVTGVLEYFERKKHWKLTMVKLLAAYPLRRAQVWDCSHAGVIEANTAGLHLAPPSRGCHYQQDNGARHVQDQHMSQPCNAAPVLLCTG